MIPSIGWDYQSVGSSWEYTFESEIGGGYLAATLVWDRRVQKSGGSNYLEGDTFTMQDLEDQMNNLDLYLMPASSDDFMDAIAVSNSMVQNVEHIFFNIQTPGEYKLVVHNNVIGGIGDNQAYALAWWFGDPTTIPIGDYDGNGDNVINAADYVIWRDNLGAGSDSGTVAAVPKPSSLTLFAVSGTIFMWRRAARQKP